MSDKKYWRTCHVCRGEPSCLAQHKHGLVCTRPEGHEGKHIACGAKHQMLEWSGAGHKGSGSREAK